VRRIAGIDVGSETHVIAVVDENGGVLHKATAFGEDAAGYRRVRELLGGREDLLVAMEATGVYWSLGSNGTESTVSDRCQRAF
jgi:transposase